MTLLTDKLTETLLFCLSVSQNYGNNLAVSIPPTTFVPPCLLVNSFGAEEDNGTSSSDSDGEILKQFEISVSRSQTFRARASVRRERPRSVQTSSINQDQEPVGSELSDREGETLVPAFSPTFPHGELALALATENIE